MQGTEAVYLLHKAGYYVLLADKNENSLAAGLADEFKQIDFCDKHMLKKFLLQADFVVPALENKQALSSVIQVADEINKPIMFDMKAYEISSSKIISDKLFQNLNIPAPQPWPCEFPVVVKPSNRSGSEGVKKLIDKTELRSYEKDNEELVIQEYVAGPSYSLEIIACNGKLQTFEVTELEMDEIYDCKRVLAPARLNDTLAASLAQMARKLAENMNLTGIMDLEVILHKGQLKLLEIDARLPSQTPTAVFNSSGINMLENYVEGIKENSSNNISIQAAIYEQILVTGDMVKLCGEHIMSGRGRLHLENNFFGADEAITDYNADKDEWAAILIINGLTIKEALQKEKQVIKNIMKQTGKKIFENLQPQL